MSTFLYSHTSCVQHDPGPRHPECPERLRAVLDGLDDRPFQHLSRHEAPEIDLQLVEMVHQPYYVEKIVEVPQVQVQERIIHRPVIIQQEREVHVPKIEYVERIVEARGAQRARVWARPPRGGAADPAPARGRDHRGRSLPGTGDGGV